MGNMVVCSSLAIGAAEGGRRALNWIHPTWSACAELHNVRERDLIICGNKSNKQLRSDCHTQCAEERKEGKRGESKTSLWRSATLFLYERMQRPLSNWPGGKCRRADEGPVHVIVGVVFARVCVRQKNHAVYKKLSLAVSRVHGINLCVWECWAAEVCGQGDAQQ